MVGALLASFGAGALFFSVTAGRMVARLGQPGLAAFGSIALAAGYATLAVMPWPWLAVPAIALVGLGFYMLHNTLQTNATQMVARGAGARHVAVRLHAVLRPVCRASPSAPPSWTAMAASRSSSPPRVIVIAIAFWFRRQLVARMRNPG